MRGLGAGSPHVQHALDASLEIRDGLHACACENGLDSTTTNDRNDGADITRLSLSFSLVILCLIFLVKSRASRRPEIYSFFLFVVCFVAP